MQIALLIIPRIAVNVVDYFARLRADDFAMFPLSAVPLFPVPQAERSECFRVVPMALFGRWAGGISRRKFCDRADHFVTATNMGSVRHFLALALVCIQRVAMLSRHLIVPVAHIPRNGRALAMQARATDDLSAPTVFWRSVPLDALVVHQAKAVCRMLSSATVNRAKRHKLSHFWLSIYGVWEVSNQALGNSWAIPVVRWICERLDAELRKDAP